MYSAEPLPHFVDEYLAYLHEVHPTNATFDGVHVHDDLLEDLSRQAIDRQVGDLGGFARRLAAIDPARLTDIERLERPALENSIRARLFELEQVRTWERNPQYYADIIATSLAGQALFEYAPLSERARRVVSKLRQVPRLIQAARDNIKDAPGIFVKIGLESMRGTRRFIEADLPRAFSRLDDLHILGDLADTATEASAAIGKYIEYLEQDLLPRCKGSFRLGREKFEEKLRLDEGITLADLMGTLDFLFKALFGQERRTEFRTHYFPFTEPSIEAYVSCHVCDGDGCPVCRHSGWIEIGGAGMVDPKLFEFVGYDPERYSGFAFGWGLERIAMLRHEFPDLRELWRNDLRFSRQF